MTKIKNTLCSEKCGLKHNLEVNALKARADNFLQLSLTKYQHNQSFFKKYQILVIWFVDENGG
jgi:hypothetical protein